MADSPINQASILSEPKGRASGLTEASEQSSKRTPADVKRLLSSPGNIDFLDIACSLISVELDFETRVWIGERVSKKIEDALTQGQFEDLRGARELMDVVGLEHITFTNGLLNHLNNQLPIIDERPTF